MPIRRLVQILSLVLATAGIAIAHTKPRPVRELVRIQGTVREAGKECASGTIELQILRRSLTLCKGSVRRLAVATDKVAEDQPLPERFELQGERSELVELQAPAGTRVTILGEWRPGRRDLFLIAADRCPCPEE